MTVEVKNKLHKIEEIVIQLPDIIYTGLCEEMSPNDFEFNSIYEKNLEEARVELEYILKTSDL